MARSVNKVTLIGNLGNDPEMKALPSGNQVANLSIARQTHGAIKIVVKCKNAQSGIVSSASTGLRKYVGNICERGRGFILREV